MRLTEFLHKVYKWRQKCQTASKASVYGLHLEAESKSFGRLPYETTYFPN